MSPDEARPVGHMAIGRLLRLLSRPYQPGDEQEYAGARAALMDASDARGIDTGAGYMPNYARDRRTGAAGD